MHTEDLFKDISVIRFSGNTLNYPIVTVILFVLIDFWENVVVVFESINFGSIDFESNNTQTSEQQHINNLYDNLN